MTLKIVSIGGLAAARSCPRATQDVGLNLKNRQKAIKVAMYGPANPGLANDDYWRKLASVWGVSLEEAKTMRCGNCAAFNITSRMRSCISEGLGGEEEAAGVIKAGVLGYCQAFQFKCAALRTCSAWVVGGPQKDDLRGAFSGLLGGGK
jgi:hypothetical protein